ncbi:hypothetical protein [Pseudomonas indica]|uniref:Uncharacterized protein n=1 Tax=Pseudomonas indica TaxID=137658 RepID=A0A1G8V632_9PSED|nr:hypothetical protein [Pseudomonas indica]SDJ61449.1 hypothetical protein SAMN05216186_102109 [Pseudomonas indica]
MSFPMPMLGGVPIHPHAGLPDESAQPIGGSTVLRLSDGAGVKMTHWRKESGSISGSGWMPPGLAGLDYNQPLELRSTQTESIVGTATSYTLTSTPRPDVTPWAEALVGKDWVLAAASTVDGVMSITPVAGASLYRACWLPVYSVFAEPAQRSLSVSNNAHGWSITWEEA